MKVENYQKRKQEKERILLLAQKTREEQEKLAKQVTNEEKERIKERVSSHKRFVYSASWSKALERLVIP